MKRFMYAALFIAVSFTSLRVDHASAIEYGTLSVRIVSRIDGSALAGREVYVAAGPVQLAGKSMADGTVAFRRVPFGECLVTVTGTSTSLTVDVTENQTTTTVLVDVAGEPPAPGKLQVVQPTAEDLVLAAPPAPRPAPRPAPAVAPVPLVHDSLLGLYNAAHPVHARSEPYYGRYSYVVLHDGDETTKAKNLAFVTKLVDKFSSTGSSVRFFNGPAVTDTPYAYNVFFFPVRDGTSEIKVAAHAGAAERILDEYDFDASRTIRAAYCSVAGHGSRSLCTIPYANGPVLFTFLRPLPDRLNPTNLPTAFAYDFSKVVQEQFDQPLDTVQQKISVGSPIAADEVLPPPLAANLASRLEMLATALNAGMTGVHAWVDK